MIRAARKDDIPALRDIYNDAVLHTAATYDTEVKDMENRTEWFVQHQKNPYLILVEEDETTADIKGYVSLSEYRERRAFCHTVEISVYIDARYRGQGIGRQLMEKTVALAKENPAIHTIVSLIDDGNAASIRLHEALGFAFCGKLRQVGYKFDRWLDLCIYQLDVQRGGQ